MNHLFSLDGKVAIVTGGNGGIGKGIARGLASMGADLAIIGRNLQKTEAAVNEIKEAFGVRVVGLICDVTDEKAVKQMTDKVLRDLGRIDILVNNAVSTFAGCRRTTRPPSGIRYWPAICAARFCAPNSSTRR